MTLQVFSTMFAMTRRQLKDVIPFYTHYLSLIGDISFTVQMSTPDSFVGVQPPSASGWYDIN